MEKLKQILDERQIPYMRIARELGISRQAINNWFAGKCKPTISHLVAVSRILHVSLEEIIPEE